MTNTPSVLIVEDDHEIGDLTARYLQERGMDVEVVGDGAAMDVAMRQRTFEIIILDLNLPGEDGLSICRRLRAESAIPIIVVTAQGSEVDRIVGLEMGADDYLVKPFNFRELLARMRAVLRRVEGKPIADDTTPNRGFAFAGWRLNLLTREVQAPQGNKVAMTGAEFDLLHAFCESPNRVLTRDQLLNMTHGATPGPYERSVDVLISRLRQKMESDPKNPALIQTVRSEGYMFCGTVTRS